MNLFRVSVEPSPPCAPLRVKLIDVLEENVGKNGERMWFVAARFSCFCLSFPSDIGEGRKAVEKKNVQSRPSSLNGAMRDDEW